MLALMQSQSVGLGFARLLLMTQQPSSDTIIEPTPQQVLGGVADPTLCAQSPKSLACANGCKARDRNSAEDGNAPQRKAACAWRIRMDATGCYCPVTGGTRCLFDAPVVSASGTRKVFNRLSDDLF